MCGSGQWQAQKEGWKDMYGEVRQLQERKALQVQNGTQIALR